MGLFSRHGRRGQVGWQPDGTGVQSTGDIGGDVQRGDSFSVRFTRPDSPGSLLTVAFYAAEGEEQPGEYFIQRATERLVCNDPADPDATEIWSDVEYADVNGREFWRTAAEAEAEAWQCAEDAFADGRPYFGWDGQPDWSAA